MNLFVKIKGVLVRTGQELDAFDPFNGLFEVLTIKGKNQHIRDNLNNFAKIAYSFALKKDVAANYDFVIKKIKHLPKTSDSKALMI